MLIDTAGFEHTGQYEVVASNAAGTAKCIAFLSIEQRLPTPPPREPAVPPVFTRQLTDITVTPGESVTFEVDVTGSPKPLVSLPFQSLYVLPEDEGGLTDEENELRLYEETERSVVGLDDDQESVESGLYISNMTVIDNYSLLKCEHKCTSDDNSVDVCEAIPRDDERNNDEGFCLELSGNSFYTDSIDRYFKRREFQSDENYSGYLSLGSLSRNDLKSLEVLQKEEYIRCITNSVIPDVFKEYPVLDADEFRIQYDDFLTNYDVLEEQHDYVVDRPIAKSKFVDTGVTEFMEPVKLVNLLDILQKKMTIPLIGISVADDESGYASASVSACTSGSQRHSSDTSSSRNSTEMLDDDIDTCELLTDAVTLKLNKYRDDILSVSQNVSFIPSIRDIENNGGATFKSQENNYLIPSCSNSSHEWSNDRSVSVLSAISEESFVTESDVEAAYGRQDSHDSSVLESSISEGDAAMSCWDLLDGDELRNVDILRIESREERKKARLAKLKYYTAWLSTSAFQNSIDASRIADSNSSAKSYKSIEYKSIFNIQKVKSIILDSFSIDIPCVLPRSCLEFISNDFASSESADSENSSVPSELNTSLPLEATMSEGAFIFCIKTFESVSVSQLIRMVRDKLSTLLDMTRSPLQRMIVRFVHADPEVGTGIIASVADACAGSARHLVFEAFLGAKSETLPESSEDPAPLFLQAGFFMVYVLLQHYA